MQMYFSPSRMGFYCKELHGNAIPPDAVPISDALYQSAMGKAIEVVNGLPSVVVPPPIDPVPALVAAVQAALDAAARSRGYDDIGTAITYRGDKNPKFAAEAEVFFNWRSDVWTTAYAILADVKAGKRSLPTEQEAVDLLPTIHLPT